MESELLLCAKRHLEVISFALDYNNYKEAEMHLVDALEDVKNIREREQAKCKFCGQVKK